MKANVDKFQGILDDRASMIEGNYIKFTGLMYAVLNGRFDIFLYLLPFEMGITLQRSSVLLLVKKDKKMYYLLEAGSTVCNIAAITGQQQIYTWMIQQKDNRLFKLMYEQLCTNQCIIQAI